MKVVIRADASARLGWGHVMRCRTLARALRQRGAEVVFVCRQDPGNLIDWLKEDGWTILPLSAQRPVLEEDEDAAATLDAVGPNQFDWMIVDHYGLGAPWERRLRPRARGILAIDDLANRDHACDILLDQNYFADPRRRHANLARARLCLGPYYALLGDDYAQLPDRVPRAAVDRILVSFGAADRDNMTALALEALNHPDFATIAVDIVASRTHPDRDRLEMAASARPHTTVYGPQPSLKNLMATADLAIGAGGTTTWERLRAGIPALVVTLADNQVAPSRDLATTGAIDYLGTSDKVTAKDLETAVRKLMADPARRQRMTEGGQHLVDGQGARRMAELLCPSPEAALTLRPAQAADRTFYFNLANDPEVRGQSFSSDAIPWDAHCAWFARKLQDPDAALWVLTAGDLAVGQIRFDPDAVTSGVRLSYSLESFVRGRGWGRRLVELGVERLMREKPAPIVAEVKPENAASRRIFEGLGFTPGDRVQDGRLLYTLTPNNSVHRRTDK